LLDHLSGAVGAVIIDKNDLVADAFKGPVDIFHQRYDIIPFIQRRHDD